MWAPPRIGSRSSSTTGVKLLDVVGPAEVFGEANRLGADYKMVLVSPTGADVTSSIGIRISVDTAATETAPDTFLVAGADLYPRTPVPRDLIEAVRTLAGRAHRVASICTGAFVLGAAGLLDGKRATTHWKVAQELAVRCRASRVEPDAIYVRDGTTYTSAGVTAGIDLALALVEEDHGPDLTRDVARALVVYLQRSGGQSQFSAPLQGPPPRSPALRRITDLITANPGETTHSANATAVPQDAELTRARRRAVHRAGVRLGPWAVAGLAVTGGRNLPCVLPRPPLHAGHETQPASRPAAPSHACDRLTGTSYRTERSWNRQGTRRGGERLWIHRSAALVTWFPPLGLWQWRLRTVC